MNHLEKMRRLLKATQLLESIPLTAQPRTAGRIAKQAKLGRLVAYRLLPILTKHGYVLRVIQKSKYLGKSGEIYTYYITKKGVEWLESQRELF